MKLDHFTQKLSEEVEIISGLEDLIPVYISNVRKDYEKMGGAIQSKDFQQVAELAHKTKGSAKSYGFDYLDELMREIELDLDEGQENLEGFVSCFGKFIEKVEEKVNKD